MSAVFFPIVSSVLLGTPRVVTIEAASRRAFRTGEFVIDMPCEGFFVLDSFRFCAKAKYTPWEVPNTHEMLVAVGQDAATPQNVQLPANWPAGWPVILRGRYTGLIPKGCQKNTLYPLAFMVCGY